MKKISCWCLTSSFQPVESGLVQRCLFHFCLCLGHSSFCLSLLWQISPTLFLIFQHRKRIFSCFLLSSQLKGHLVLWRPTGVFASCFPSLSVFLLQLFLMFKSKTCCKMSFTCVETLPYFSPSNFPAWDVVSSELFQPFFSLFLLILLLCLWLCAQQGPSLCLPLGSWGTVFFFLCFLPLFHLTFYSEEKVTPNDLCVKPVWLLFVLCIWCNKLKW